MSRGTRRLATALAAFALAVTIGACATPRPPPPIPSPAGTPSRDPLPAEPPIAVLTFPGGRPVAGDLGSYAYRGSGSDSPWLPGEPVNVPPAGTFARVLLSEPVPVASWSARIVPAGQPPDIRHQQEIAAATGPIEFELPTGPWSLMLSVEFADGVGSASWFWELGQG